MNFNKTHGNQLKKRTHTASIEIDAMLVFYYASHKHVMFTS